MAEDLRQGMGTLAFWGNTPAYDFLEIGQNYLPNCPPEEEVNILLMGQSDCRHIFQTLFKTLVTNSDGNKELHFHIVESHPVLYCRQLLFLHLLFLPKDQLGLHERTAQFMEIFGNILIRPQTKNTLRKACLTLINIVTNDSLRDEQPFVHMSNLKHRERDHIVEIFKFWADSKISCDAMQNLWDNRIRLCLNRRYDTRLGVFDWDYQMRIVEKNSDTKIIDVKEYKSWRNRGLAFTQYENDYNQANPTLLSGKGELEYKGDLLVGPFIPFGIRCEDKTMFEIRNREFNNKSQDLSHTNLQRIFEQLIQFQEDLDQDGSKNKLKFKINFLSLTAATNLWRKTNFLNKFDLVHVSSFAGHQIQPEMVKLIKKDGIVLVDKTRYIWYFREENDKAYEEKVVEFTTSAGLVVLPSSEFTKDKEIRDDFMIFKQDQSHQSQIVEGNDITAAGATQIHELGQGDFYS